ncbi:hypothetical protein M8J75_002994 [Diaphorina citri]|nr:hypothetical protein M8J75_002994 [Diaphorina citri]
MNNLLHKPPDPTRKEEEEKPDDSVKHKTSASIFSSPLSRIRALCRKFYESRFVDRTPESSPSKFSNVAWETKPHTGTQTVNNPSLSTPTSVNILPEYSYFIDALLASQLILKDDLNILEHFIPNREKHEVLSKKYNYRGSVVLPSTLVLIIVGANKYYFNNNVRYAIPCLGLTVSSYYLLHKLYTSYQLNKYKRDLHTLISILQKYSNLIHKNIQFIRDFENISKIHQATGVGVLNSSSLLNGKSNKEAWCKLPHLRFNLLGSLNAMCSLAYYNVLELVARFPFNPHLDPYIKHGLCCLDLTELGVSDVPLERVDDITVKMLMKVKYIYFLLLSEFLSRLILCFCPYTSSSPLHPVSPPRYIASLFRLINKTSAIYTEQYSSLENLFNVVTIHKTQEQPGPGSYLVSNPRSADRKYEELVKTIHCIETYLLFLLTQYKHMETNIGTYQHSDCIINDNVILNDIYSTHTSIRSNQLTSLLYNIDCLNIQLSQCVSTDDTKPGDNVAYNIGGGNVDPPTTAVQVGFSDFNVANVRDEIFLGIAGVPVSGNVLDGGGGDRAFLDEDQVNYYEFERQFSTTVLNELKLKLKDKQVEWKRREKLALEMKDMEDFSDLEPDGGEKVTAEVTSVKEDAHRKRRKRKSITKTHAIESLSDTEDFDVTAVKPHPPRSARSKASQAINTPSLGTLISDANQKSLLSTDDFSENNGADIKYKRLYNLSRSQESYENRETSPSSGEEPEDSRTRMEKSRAQTARDNEVLAAALFTSQSSLAAQIEQVAREWKYTSIEEEFGDEGEEGGE